MNDTENAFSALARRAGRGDAAARAQMECDLIPIVRRALCNGAGTSCLERCILEAARRWVAGAAADQDQLVRRVAHSLCSSVIARMGPAMTAEQMAAETVVNYAGPDRRRSA